MSLTAAASGFVVFLLSLQVIQGQNGWGVTYTPTKICAVKGSTVEINCRYRYPSRINSLDTTVKETFWFAKLSGYESVDLRTDSRFAGRVQFICGNNDCTLRITDLRESDSAEYKFRFTTNQAGGSYIRSPGVTLTVTGLLVNTWHSGIKCDSSCRLPGYPSYVWYKNGQKIQTETSYYSVQFNSEDSYSCAFKGREDFPSPSVCVNGQSCNRVMYTNRNICALKGSSVDISCTYNSYNAFVESKFWFSPQRVHQWQSPSQPEDLSEDSQYAGRVQVLDTERGRSTLRITDLTERDSAEYRFKFTTEWFEWGSSLPGTTLTVTALQVQVTKVTVHQSHTKAELTCHSSCSLPGHPSYVWYKNGEKIQKETSYYYSVSYHYADSYSCAVKGQEDFPSPPVCAVGQSCYRVTYTNRNICAPKGSSVDISCTYSNSYGFITSKFWFSPQRVHQWQSPSQPKDLSEDSQYAGRVQVLDTERGRSTLRITDLTERDSAEYRFKFKTRWFEWNSILPGTTLTVTALQVQVTKVTVHQSHTEAELKCHSSCSPAAHFSYVWFKNGQKVMGKETSSYTDDFYPGDNICCAFKGHEDYRSPSLYAPRLPSVSVSPLNDIIEGSSVTLNCNSDANPAATYTWYSTSETLTPLSKEPQLVFSPIKTSDSGNYYCEAENELGKSRSEDISINVKYGPKTPSLSKSLSGEIAEGSLVTLTCKSDANPAAEYVWYKKNQILPWNSKDIYRFTSISSEDSGIYHCMAVNKHGQINSTSVRIDVLFGPKLPTVSVSPPDEIMEGSSVNLTCSSDANPAATYTWYKENEDSPKASGQLFTITDIRPEHSGNYYCEASNKHGHNNSTSLLIVVASPMKSVGAGSITTILLVIFLAIISLFAFFFIRRKKSLKENTEQPDNTAQLNTGSVCNGPSAAGQRKPAEEQEDLCYASVRFFKHQEDAVYYNIRPAHSKKEEEEEEEDDVDYTIVNCNSASTFPEPGSRDEVEVEDPSALYSTVPKKTRV